MADEVQTNPLKQPNAPNQSVREPTLEEVGWPNLKRERRELLDNEALTYVERYVPLIAVHLEFISLLYPCYWLKAQCPAHWFKKGISSLRNVTDVYAMVLAGILTALLVSFSWHLPSRRGVFFWLVVIVAAYGAYDITRYRLYTLLVAPIRPSPIGRRVAFALVNFYELVAAYAILYLLSDAVASGGKRLCSALTAVYYSLVTMATLGYGDYAPTKWWAQAIVIAQIISSLVFLAYILPTLVTLILDEKKAESS